MKVPKGVTLLTSVLPRLQPFMSIFNEKQNCL